MDELEKLPMTSVETYTATIYCGMKEGYEGKCHDIADVRIICQDFIEKNKVCITLTETDFLYVGGSEPGVIIGIINYPRLPFTKEKIRRYALKLANLLKEECKQKRVSVVFPDTTVMIGELN